MCYYARKQEKSWWTGKASLLPGGLSAEPWLLTLQLVSLACLNTNGSVSERPLLVFPAGHFCQWQVCTPCNVFQQTFTDHTKSISFASHSLLLLTTYCYIYIYHKGHSSTILSTHLTFTWVMFFVCFKTSIAKITSKLVPLIIAYEISLIN